MPIPEKVAEAGKAADEALLNTQGKTMDPKKADPKALEGSEIQGEVIDLAVKKVVKPHEDTVETLRSKMGNVQHKLDVLQGKYDKEIVPLKDDIGILTRLKSENRKLREAHDGLLVSNTKYVTLIADLQKQITEPKPATEIATKSAGNVKDFIPAELLSPEDIEILDDEGIGKEALGVFNKLIKGALGTVAQPAEPVPDTKLESRVETLEQDKQENSVQKYWREVFEGVSGETNPIKAREGFAKVNNDAGLNDWLDITDTFTGQTRRALLESASKTMDSARVIDIFNLFKSTDKKAVPTKKTEGIEKELEVSSSNTTRVIPDTDADMESLAAKWTQPEMKKFYAEAAKGKYSDKEYKALEAEIWRVQQRFITNT